MSDQTSTRLWGMRAAFAALVLAILFFHLLPLQVAPGGLIWPDLILTFAIAWSIRRPEYVPATLLAGCFLLADLLLQRPPGLMALLTLIACESLKLKSHSLRDASLATEFLSAAAWIVGVNFGYRLILALLLVETPPLGPSLIQIIVTLLFYPLVAGITHGLMGVRKAAPGDIGGGLRS